MEPEVYPTKFVENEAWTISLPKDTDVLDSKALVKFAVEHLKSVAISRNEELKYKEEWRIKSATSDMFIFKGVRMTCAREGFSKKLLNSERKRSRGESKRCNCKLQVYVEVQTQQSKTIVLVVKKIGGCHNHPLLLEEYSNSKRWEKILAAMSREELATLIKNYSACGHAPHMIRDTLFTLHGCHVDVKTICNIIASQRKKAGALSECARLVEKLRDIREAGGDFSIQHDKHGTLENLIWFSPKMLQNLREFGQVLIMDTAAKRNKYNMPLFFCCAIDNNGKTVLVAAAIMFDEGTSSWDWVLRELNRAINDQTTVFSIFTDSDLAIIESIKTVFPYARHFLCIFHIYLNLCKNLAGLLGTQFASFLKAFQRMRNASRLCTFELLWKSLLGDYPDAASYLERQLKGTQEKWARAHMMFAFTLETNATSRVEGLNFSLANVGMVELDNLVDHVERRLQTMEYRRNQDDYLTSQRIAVLNRSEECHRFGRLRKLLVSYTSPYCVARIAKQMEFAHDYSLNIIPTLSDALKLVKDHEQEAFLTANKDLIGFCCGPQVNCDVAPLNELQSAQMENLSKLSPGGLKGLDYLYDEQGEDTDATVDLLRTAEYQLPSDTKIVLCSHKLAPKTAGLHLLLLYPNGGYFCSCGYLARTGLLCRHFLFSYLQPEAKLCLNIALLIHPRYWKDDLKKLPNWDTLTVKTDDISAEFLESIEKRISLWHLSSLHPGAFIPEKSMAEEDLEDTNYAYQLFGMHPHSVLDPSFMNLNVKREFTNAMGLCKRLFGGIEQAEGYRHPKIKALLDSIRELAEKDLEDEKRLLTEPIDFSDPESIALLQAPGIRIGKGRPKVRQAKQARFKSGGELNSRKNKCKRCGESGHNQANKKLCRLHPFYAVKDVNEQVNDV